MDSQKLPVLDVVFIPRDALVKRREALLNDINTLSIQAAALNGAVQMIDEIFAYENAPVITPVPAAYPAEPTEN